MSNIGKQPITVPEGVQVDITGSIIRVNGSKGVLETVVPKGIKVTLKDGILQVAKENESPELAPYFGLSRTLIANLVKGVTDGFEKKLELTGVGYRAKIEGRDLVMSVGFANAVRLTPPTGISVKVEENIITVEGINKQYVGDFASRIRKVRPPDPYKGKGTRYVGEHIRKKAGKAGKAASAA